MSRKSKRSRFRSTFEQDVAKVLQDFDYEPFTVPYTISRSYRPDFVHAASGVLVECKGFFREGDTKKYTSIRDSLPDGQELVFVLMQPNKKIRKAAKMTMAKVAMLTPPNHCKSARQNTKALGISSGTRRLAPVVVKAETLSK